MISPLKLTPIAKQCEYFVHWLMLSTNYELATLVIGKVESCVWLHLASYYMCMAHISDANTSQVGVSDKSPWEL